MAAFRRDEGRRVTGIRGASGRSTGCRLRHRRCRYAARLHPEQMLPGKWLTGPSANQCAPIRLSTGSHPDTEAWADVR